MKKCVAYIAWTDKVQLFCVVDWQNTVGSVTARTTVVVGDSVRYSSDGGGGGMNGCELWRFCNSDQISCVLNWFFS